MAMTAAPPTAPPITGPRGTDEPDEEPEDDDDDEEPPDEPPPEEPPGGGAGAEDPVDGVPGEEATAACVLEALAEDGRVVSVTDCTEKPPCDVVVAIGFSLASTLKMASASDAAMPG